MYIGSGPTRSGIVYNASVWQSTYTLLDWLYNHFGGGVYGRHGSGYGKNSRKSTGEWRVTGVKAFNFLTAIQPYVVFRKAEIEVMLLAWCNRSDKILFSKISELRKQVRAAAETECDGIIAQFIADNDATVRSAGTIQPAEVSRNVNPPHRG